MSEFQGKRLEDGEFPENPGEYSKTVIPRSIGGEVKDYTGWLCKAPDGGSVFHIGIPNVDGSAFHWVHENEDGTITVEPNPSDAPPERRNSNSIVAPRGWHGYIYNGVWRSV